MKKSFLLFFFFVSTAISAQQMGTQTLAQLNESPAGSKLLAWLDLINKGEKITEASIEQLFSKRLVNKFSAATLKEMLEDIHQQDGQLELYVADRTEKFRYETTFLSGNTGEWMGGFFILEKTPPYSIDGFGLNEGTQPKGIEQPIYGADKKTRFSPKLDNSIPSSELAKKADKISQAYHDMGWFSGTVLIAEKGKPIFEKSYGLADIKNNVQNTPQTKFRIGSINKDYTAVLVLQQVQRGNVSLEDKLSKFDLGFPKNIADKISVRQLLNHTAGFGDIFIPEYLDNIRVYKNINDILPLLMNEPLIFEPGIKDEYSNYGYIVLGAILEKITGESFGQLLDKNIHAITGCKNTHYDIAENLQGAAKSYRYSVTGNKTDHTPQLEYPTSDGGMYATADDLLGFFQTLFYSEKLLKNKYKTLMVNGFRPAKMAWNELLGKPRVGIGFAGGGPGVSAVVEANFHENHFTIILANTDRQIAEDVAEGIMAAKKGRKYIAPKLPPANFLFSIYKKNGKKYLINNFKNELKNAGYEDRHPGLLNNTGYSLMHENKIVEAIDIFHANVELFPKEANPYDSLAEAYLEKGDKKNALKYYEMALEIDPRLPSAKRAVEKLK